ncbi:MAG: histidine kinase [Chitinophagaceae bacterium]
MKTLSIILLLCTSVLIHAQEHSYKQFTTADGLPSNVVYSVFQDKKGYIWFCTNAGVSRFNGISFQNFTVENGLSDNEVFGAFTTGSDKIWFRTFSNKLCYYENDTFHNPSTDKWLNSSFGGLRLPYTDGKGHAWSREFIEPYVYMLDENNKTITRMPFSRNDSIIIVTARELSVISAKEDSVIEKKIDEFASRNKAAIDKMQDLASYFMLVRNYLYTLKKEHPAASLYYFYLLFSGRNIASRFRLHDLVFSNAPGDSSYWVLHPNKGIARGKNLSDVQERPQIYLADRHINHVMADREGNFWFTSPTEGVFLLNAHAVKTYDPGKEGAEIYSVTGNSRYIVCGKDNQVMFINRQTGEKFKWQFNLSQNGAAYNRIKDLLIEGDDTCWIGSDIGLVSVRFSNKKAERIFPSTRETYSLNDVHAGAMKSLARGSDKKIYIGSHAALFNIGADHKMKLMAVKRITAIIESQNNELLIGSTNGLFEFRNGNIEPYTGGGTHISQHITDLQKGSDFICAATNDFGLILKKEDKFFRIVANDSLQLLTSNICRKIFIDSSDNIWACTNKGLCKVSVRTWNPFTYEVQQFTTDDGLISNDVNDVYVSDDTVWAATSGGLSYFRQSEVKHSGAIPIIYISRIDTLMDRSFSYRTKIAIGLEGISYESLGKLRYRYRLKGLYEDWRYTDRNQLLYDVLPPGYYQLEVYSINRFGEESAPAVAAFTIVPPWWATNWAYALYFIIFVALLGAAFALVRRNSRRKERARMKHIQQLQQLELKALRSQMNPHFIFNTLNAVQKYILENDKEASYRYLTRFSKLIRSFLENSRQTSISLKDELDLLRAYMEMEALRFRNRFTYEIEIDHTLDPVSVYIPSMLIQPYVENAIWHGIQHKETNGFVKLSVQNLGGNVLRCRIQDNGIGRKKAGEIESVSVSRHQPVGMTITQQRLEIINERLKQVSVNFIDIEDELPGQGSGTIVELVVTYLTKKP